MNNERLRARGRLLNDVLAQDSGSEKVIAMAAFRRARFERRLRSLGGLAVIVAASLAVGVHYYRIERPTIIAVKTWQPQATAIVTETSRALVKLTDQELLASFPSNSCFLAEVNGRQILVFNDRSMREQFLHKPAELSEIDGAVLDDRMRR